ncbi:hypothetical protein ACOI22_09435 [Glaciecola sp. 2405UD65-10]|uniref:hypothetical protein n=1 Tax=Glaciecola sp. 2405UD65-10 TaxID=3397244 RepID=UPI003B5BAA0A
MNLLKHFMFAVLVCFAFTSSAQGLIIVANTNDNLKIEKRQVRDLFMGNNSQISLQPIALSPSSETRFVFNTKIVGLTESRIQSYWTQMRFSGRRRPPKEFDSIEKVLEYLKSTPGSVAYIPSGTEIPSELTVIYQVD